MDTKIDWVKCHHDWELRNGRCPKCEEERRMLLKSILTHRDEPPKKIPIYRGCNAKGGCFCSGACKEIIGYREPLFYGEKVPNN